MDATQPIVIKKTYVGLIAIVLVTLVVTTGIVLAAEYARAVYSINIAAYMAAIASAFVVALLGGVGAYVYSLSSITLDDTGITVNNWKSLIIDVNAQCDWSEVQDVTSTQAGVGARLFNYGTLLIQTAGTQTNLELSMVPAPDYWQGIIRQRVKS